MIELMNRKTSRSASPDRPSAAHSPNNSMSKLARLLAVARSAEDSPRWIDEVLAGDLDKLPSCPFWSGISPIAQICDGYEFATRNGFGDLMKFAERATQSAFETREWNGDAVSLWLCIFFHYRKIRWNDGYTPPEDEGMLDALAIAFREAFVVEMRLLFSR